MMMDISWTSPAWAVAMTLVLGAASGAVVFIGLRIANAPRLPDDIVRHRQDLELDTRAVTMASVALADAVRTLVARVQTLPPEYQPIAVQALRLAELTEQAALEEAARHGLAPRPVFGGEGDREPLPVGASLVEPVAASELPGRVVQWVGGQIVPAGKVRRLLERAE